MHCSLDLCKYKLIRGLLENNLGEPIEDFMRPYDLQDPRIHVSETALVVPAVAVPPAMREQSGEAGGTASRLCFFTCEFIAP